MFWRNKFLKYLQRLKSHCNMITWYRCIFESLMYLQDSNYSTFSYIFVSSYDSFSHKISFFKNFIFLFKVLQMSPFHSAPASPTPAFTTLLCLSQWVYACMYILSLVRDLIFLCLYIYNIFKCLLQKLLREYHLGFHTLSQA